MVSLLPAWTVREIRAQYRQSAFDLGWSLITPVVTLVGYGFVLTRTFGVTGAGVPYLAFAWTGVVIWTFAANSLLKGASSLVAAADLVRKVSFPKEVVPLSAVFSAGLDLAIGFAVLGLLMLIQGVHIAWTIVAALPVLLLLVVWTSACAVLFAALSAFTRDFTHGLAVLLRIGIFVTPVMYPPSKVPARYHWLLDLNPIAVFIEGIRSTVLYDRWPRWELLGTHAVAALLLLIVAIWYVERVEGRLADVI